MKRGWKVFWIICGAVFCLGAVFCIAGRIMGVTFSEAASEVDTRAGLLFFDTDDPDEDIGMISRIHDDRDYGYGERAEEPGFEKSYSGVRRIDVDAAGIQLQVLASPDKDVHVEGANIDKKLQFKCVQNKKELKITTTKNLHKINRIDGYATVWLLLPETQLEELDLSNDAGEVYVANAEAIELSLSIGAGMAEIEGFTAREADLECGAGQITAEGTVLRTGNLECGVGEITLTLNGSETDYSYDVDCGIGEVTIGGQSYSGIGISKSDDDDDDDENEHRSGKELSIECGIGSVDVNFTEY